MRVVLLGVVLSPATVRGLDADVIVYGATPGGLGAALSACAAPLSGDPGRNLTVLLVEPTPDIGGMMTAGGIGLRDIGAQKAEVRGIPYDWAMLNAQHYRVDSPQWQPDNWVGNASWHKMLANYSGCVRLLTSTALAEIPGPTVRKVGTKVLAIAVSSTAVQRPGNDAGVAWLSAGQFIDASYEGDLMAAAGVKFTVGRESEQQYGEKYAGVRDPHEYYTFSNDVPVLEDPDGPADGPLIPYVYRGRLADVGSADDNVMGYSYRLCTTLNKDRQVPWPKPDGYKTDDFRLLTRTLQARLANQNRTESMGSIFAMYAYASNQVSKFDLCDSQTFPVTSDAPGLAKGYIDGSRSDRLAIAAKHRYYLLGMLWCMASDPDCPVPNATRASIRNYGLCDDEWPENGHIPTQMYVREARRLVGDRVMAYNDMNTSLFGNDSIGVGGWHVDLHVVQRLAVPGTPHSHKSVLVATDEGNMMSPSKSPVFELGYSIIVPRAVDTTNLLVVNCPSVSHVVFGAIREEPTLLQLGQVAGTAAKIATHTASAVGSISITALQESLVAQGLAIHAAPKPPAPKPHKNDVVAVDCGDAGAIRWIVAPIAKGSNVSVFQPSSDKSKCLAYATDHASAGGHGQAIVLADCNPGSATQQWGLDGPLLKIAAPVKCLDYDAACQCVAITARGSASIELWGCTDDTKFAEEGWRLSNTSLLQATRQDWAPSPVCMGAGWFRG